ncbi:8-amino-7-oxononanoate synthase [Sodalis praecaptivus]
MGDNAPLAELARLQQRYGLFLFIDDSHSLSVSGPRGCGLARAHFEQLNDRTIIVASLAKTFGATGGLIMLSSRRQREMIVYCGGPLGWSQMVSTAGLGAIRAAAKIHLGDELPRLQQRLRDVMCCLDDAVPSANAGNGLPIHVFDLASISDALSASRHLYLKGFYCSAVFFPIVARVRPGIRVMGRANMTRQDIDRFCAAIRTIVGGT